MRPSPHEHELATLVHSSFLSWPLSRRLAPKRPWKSVTPTNVPTVISAGPEWIPLRPELEIEPGSALDFTDLAGTGSPAGKHGAVIARPDGQFAFADSPDQARRFYGVNLCFSAQYLSHDQADRLAERLARLGYNAVRVHHYEGELIGGQTNSTTLNPQRLDQLDYLAAALFRHGLYLTTDLFVSAARAVPGSRHRPRGDHPDGHFQDPGAGPRRRLRELAEVQPRLARTTSTLTPSGVTRRNLRWPGLP